MAEYKVKFEIFEGPLDLLLYLITKEEVDIYEVNLTRGEVHALEGVFAVHPDIQKLIVVGDGQGLRLRTNRKTPHDLRGDRIKGND